MKLENGKLHLTEQELNLVKRANMNASPSVAGMFLLNYVKNDGLEEDVEHSEHTVDFYKECVQAYRRNDFEVSD